jgi:hypothetical protein
VLPMRLATLHGTQVVRRTDGSVVGDQDELAGLAVSLGLSTNAIPCAAVEAVYSLRSASLNLFQLSAKITSWEILTSRSIAFLGGE